MIAGLVAARLFMLNVPFMNASTEGGECALRSPAGAQSPADAPGRTSGIRDDSVDRIGLGRLHRPDGACPTNAGVAAAERTPPRRPLAPTSSSHAAGHVHDETSGPSTGGVEFIKWADPPVFAFYRQRIVRLTARPSPARVMFVLAGRFTHVECVIGTREHPSVERIFTGRLRMARDPQTIFDDHVPWDGIRKLRFDVSGASRFAVALTAESSHEGPVTIDLADIRFHSR